MNHFRQKTPSALERPGCKSQADARAHALIELEMLLNFWGAAVDGMPENFKAPVCYEVGPWATSSSTRAR